MQVFHTDLDDVVVIEPEVFADGRGYFIETWKAGKYAAAIRDDDFAQDNLSRSVRGVLRGLHYQEPEAQGKLVTAISGCIFDVAVDIRRGSPTFGRWEGVELSEDNHRQFWIPAGFAHGFLTLSDQAHVSYKCTRAYAPECEHTIRWDDPELAIDWPDCGLPAPLLSDKDAAGSLLADAELPEYRTHK